MSYDRNVANDKRTGRFVSKFGSLEERFLHHVKKTEGCWMWTGAVLRYGYGKFQIAPRVTAPAHRVAWSLWKGEDPTGSVIRHTCDVPLCVRPDHLLIGTQRDNIHDCIRRGRFAFGSKNGSTKLTEDDVREIRASAASGETRKSIAARHGVKTGVIHGILSGRTWRHV